MKPRSQPPKSRILGAKYGKLGAYKLSNFCYDINIQKGGLKKNWMDAATH